MAYTRAQLERMTEEAARKYGIDPAILRSQFNAESGFDPNAESPAGAKGISQVVLKWHPTADLSTPESQIDYGAKHMGELYRKYGNYKDALSVYNSGKPWAQGQSIAETAAYVPKVLQGAKGGGPRTRPDGPVARDTGQASSNITAQMLEGLGPAPSLGASLVQGVQEGGGGLLGASTRFLGARRQHEEQRAEIKRIGQEVSKNAPEGAPAVPTDQTVQGDADSGLGGEAVELAQTKHGLQYVWGGTSPETGFDCSGLVQWVYAQQGVQLPRVTYDQIKAGVGINAKDPSKWQVGDLMFPSTGHVQIYAGNGMVTEAPRTGGVVQTVPMRDTYIAVRRPTLG